MVNAKFAATKQESVKEKMDKDTRIYSRPRAAHLPVAQGKPHGQKGGVDFQKMEGKKGAKTLHKQRGGMAEPGRVVQQVGRGGRPDHRVYLSPCPSRWRGRDLLLRRLYILNWMHHILSLAVL